MVAEDFNLSKTMLMLTSHHIARYCFSLLKSILPNTVVLLLFTDQNCSIADVIIALRKLFFPALIFFSHEFSSLLASHSTLSKVKPRLRIHAAK